MFCTYLTLYSGSKLPPFYIGSSSVKRVNKGYRGSIRSQIYKSIWEIEIKENPHLFKTKILKTYPTREAAFYAEIKLHNIFDVAKNPMYLNMGKASGHLSDASCDIIRQKALKRDYNHMKGDKHHYWGGRTDLHQENGKNPMARKCYVGDRLFSSIKEAAEFTGLSYKQFYRFLRLNQNGYRYA